MDNECKNVSLPLRRFVAQRRFLDKNWQGSVGAVDQKKWIWPPKAVYIISLCRPDGTLPFCNRGTCVPASRSHDIRAPYSPRFPCVAIRFSHYPHRCTCSATGIGSSPIVVCSHSRS